MRPGRLRPLLVVPLALAVVLVASAAPGAGVRGAAASGLSKLDPRLRAHVSGAVAVEQGDAAATSQAQSLSTYFPVGDDGCGGNIGSNVKVNQNCLNLSDADLQGRGQAQNETTVAVDPNNARHVVAAYNDYRRGDSTCGASYSRDGGANWNDAIMPTSFTRGGPFGAARQYWQGGGDPAVAWDTRGNAYLSCQLFNRGAPPSTNPDLSSAFVVYRSTGNGGASWNFPGRYSTFGVDLAGTGAVFEDKALMTVDDHVGSPFRDRVYVTWTEFTPTTAYIYEVSSADFGQTFGPRRLVSVASTLCPFPLTAGAGCDNNQFSQPFTGPDGTLYVVWDNYNTVDFTAASPGPAKFQVLVSASRDGGATFSAPQRAGSYYEVPDCATYTGGRDPGRACVPEKGPTSTSFFRVANYPSGAVNSRDPRQVAISFASYIGPHSNESNGCVPTGSVAFSTGGLYTGVKTVGACKNDILLSVSGDGGATFTGTTTDPRALPTVAPSARQATADQWFQWLAFGRDGMLAVSYYDRQYGSDETTGFSDFTLSESSDLVHFTATRATSGSMPPPTQFGGVFWGDYTGLDVSGSALPVWSDTRPRDLFLCPGSATGPGVPPQICGLQDANGPANDQDVFVTALS